MPGCYKDYRIFLYPLLDCFVCLFYLIVFDIKLYYGNFLEQKKIVM